MDGKALDTRVVCVVGPRAERELPSVCTSAPRGLGDSTRTRERLPELLRQPAQRFEADRELMHLANLLGQMRIVAALPGN
jgi:hypothetical protein